MTTRPWCYINDTAWEHCDIPECKKPSGECGRSLTAVEESLLIISDLKKVDIMITYLMKWVYYYCV